jgi:hypothetical protein
MAERIVFLLPGYGHSTEEYSYQNIGVFYREKGFEPIFVNINWTDKFEENMEQARNKIQNTLEEYETPGIHFFGHSWGAAIALNLSKEFNPKTQILCGLSQEFQEDLETFSKLDMIGRKIMILGNRIFKKIPGEERKKPEMSKLENIAKSEIGEVILFYGEKEYKGLFGWQRMGIKGEMADQRKEILDAREVIASKSGHLINTEEYLNAIGDEVEEL